MSLLRLRVELRAIRHAINELQAAIEKHSESIHAAQEARNKKDDAVQKSIPVTVSYDQQANKDQDRYYGTQEGIRKWTKRAVIAASIYATIAAVQAGLLQTANKQAKKQWEAERRPWVGIDSVPEIDTFSVINSPKFFVNLRFDLVVRNYGQSPAILSGTPYFMLSSLGKPEPRFWVMEGKSDICNHFEPLPGGPPGTPRIPIPVFQGAPDTLHISVSEIVTDQEPPISDRELYTFLSGCIVYNGPTGGPYKTRVIYRVLYSSETKMTQDGVKYHPIANIERDYFDAS